MEQASQARDPVAFLLPVLHRDGQRDRERSPCSCWAFDHQRAAESLDTVVEPDQPGAGGRVRATTTVVADEQDQPAVGDVGIDQYDGRVGLPRLLKMLDQQGVPASFFVTGVTATLYPDVIKQIMASGRHEIGVHGWIHENNTSVPPDEERRLVAKAITALEGAMGKRPVGYRSPSWAFSGATLDILRANNFLYDSGMMADDEPYEILVGGQRTGLLEIPVEWMRDDAMYYPRSNPHSPNEVYEVWRAEFDKAYEEHGLFQVTMHPRISGHRSRVAMLEKLITYMKQRPGVWFGTHEQVARHVKPAK